MSRYEHEIEEIFDAITTHVCTSRHDIAGITGWTIGKVDNVLGEIRDPEVATEWGWTIPHVPRGHGVHLYQVMLNDNGQMLDADERRHLNNGTRSTLYEVSTKSFDQAHSLRVAVNYVDTPAQKRQLRRVATALEGAAAMAEDAAEQMLNGT